MSFSAVDDRPAIPAREATMKKPMAAVMVCVAVLYAIDALCFGGWYFGVADQAVRQAYALNW